MKVELDGEQWDAVTSGTLRGPDGRVYQRRSTRTRRRQVDDLLADGAPLVLYWYGAGQLDWHDETDAAAAWASARKRLTTSVPKPDGDVVWMAGEWLSDDRSLVLLTGTC